MKIDFQETKKDLAVRIDIHSKFGSKNIDEWMLDLIKLKKGSRILDVGCGSGKQCFSFYDSLEGDAEIIGGDVSAELLNQAKAENERRGIDIRYDFLDFNQVFPYPDNYFDFVSCCFAIYYANDVGHTISEMHRVTKPGGRLFTTGPMPSNNCFTISSKKPPVNLFRPCRAARVFLLSSFPKLKKPILMWSCISSKIP